MGEGQVAGAYEEEGMILPKRDGSDHLAFDGRGANFPGSSDPGDQIAACADRRYGEAQTPKRSTQPQQSMVMIYLGSWLVTSSPCANLPSSPYPQDQSPPSATTTRSHASAKRPLILVGGAQHHFLPPWCSLHRNKYHSRPWPRRVGRQGMVLSSQTQWASQAGHTGHGRSKTPTSSQRSHSDFNQAPPLCCGRMRAR